MHKLKSVILVSLSGVFLSGCISAPIIWAGAAGAGGTNVAGNSVGVSQQWDDLTIRSNIYTLLNNIPHLNGANVEVTVFNGIVLLLGQVPTEEVKNQLADQVANIQGVLVVYNQLNVGANVAFSRFADDSWITSKVKANMVGQVNPLHFKVVTQQGVVYLLGQVTQSEGDQATAVAAQTSGVQKVVKIFNYISPTDAVPQTVNSNTSAAITPTVSAAAVPTVTPAAPPAALPATQVTPLSSPSAIPQYAPNYDLPNDPVGSAASD